MGSQTSNNPARALRRHPSFKIPPFPKEATYSAVIGWTLETAARLVSPDPKLPGENDQFACEDVAKVVRGLKRSLMEQVATHTEVKR